MLHFLQLVGCLFVVSAAAYDPGSPSSHKPSSTSQQVWRAGVDEMPHLAVGAYQVPEHPLPDMTPFDYSIPANERRLHSRPIPNAMEMQNSQVYADWVDARIKEFYSARSGAQIPVSLGDEAPSYLFNGRQVLLLHYVQKGLREVSTIMTVQQKPLQDPIESVRLRAFLQSAFTTFREMAPPHPSFPDTLRLALLSIRNQQKAEVIYLKNHQYFDDLWDTVFPFLHNDSIDMVQYYLHAE